MLQLPKSNKSAKRSLEHHVTTVHPDHTGDYKELIGETIVRSRSQGSGSKRATARKIETHVDDAPVRSRSQFEPTTSSSPDPDESDLAMFNDPAVATARASHAVTKISAILEKIDNNDNERVTVGTDAWDRAAVKGVLGEEIGELANAAFPSEMFDEEFTVTAISDEDILIAMVAYYTEKVARLEPSVEDPSV